MKINNQLALLKPTARSLETDLRCLLIHVSKHKRHSMERLFWLKTHSLFIKNKKRTIEWCPAKETYRFFIINFFIVNKYIKFL